MSLAGRATLGLWEVRRGGDVSARASQAQPRKVVRGHEVKHKILTDKCFLIKQAHDGAIPSRAVVVVYLGKNRHGKRMSAQNKWKQGRRSDLSVMVNHETRT